MSSGGSLMFKSKKFSINLRKITEKPLEKKTNGNFKVCLNLLDRRFKILSVGTKCDSKGFIRNSFIERDNLSILFEFKIITQNYLI